MNILFLTSRFPYPPHRGDRLTVLEMLRAMSVRHRVTLVTFVDESPSPEALAAVAPACARIVTVPLARGRSWAQAWLGLFSTLPSQVGYYRSGPMRAALKELLREEPFDVVLAHAIRTSAYLAADGVPLRILFQGDSVGQVLGRSLAFTPWWRRPGVRWERWRVDRYLADQTRRFAETWLLSPADAEDARRIGGVRIELVPHGVDARLFGLERAPHPDPRVMFLGNLSVPHNVDAAEYAARDIWPVVTAAGPRGRLLLAGADPVPAVRRLARPESVEVTGMVPDLADLWRVVHVLLAPLRFSTGIQNKVLEAMAAGVPVVTTPSVAEAIGARHGEHLLVAADTAGLAAAVDAVLRDPVLAGERAARARSHVRAHFSWDTPVRRLEQLVAARAASSGSAMRSEATPGRG